MALISNQETLTMVVFDHRIMAECHFVWWRRFVVPLLLLAVAIVQKVTAVAASSTDY